MKKSIALLIWILPGVVNAQGQPSIMSVVLDPATVTGGTSSTATITLSAPARNNGFDVTLSLTSPFARVTSSTITIAEGRSSQTVRVDTSPVATQQIVSLNATNRAEVRSGGFTISPPSVSSISVDPSSVRSGENSTATITLTGNAPSDGFPVNLFSNNPAVKVPASVSVASNQRTANVWMKAGTVVAQTSVTLTADARGSSKTTTLNVGPPPISIFSLQYPSSPLSGLEATRRITLSGPAPAGGTIVEISTTGFDIFQRSGTAIADTIPAGASSVSTSKPVPITSADRAFEITATLNGVSTRRSGTLKAPIIDRIELEDSLFEGTATMLTVTYQGIVPRGDGLPALITSDNQSAITSPGTVVGTHEAGADVYYRIRTNDVSSRTPVTLSLEREGVLRRVSTLVIPRPAPVLSGFTVAPASVRGGQSITITATLTGPAPKGGTLVHLVESPDLPVFDLPTTLLIPEGATSKAITVATRPFALPLRTEVNASLGDRSMIRTERSVTVTINP